MTTSTSLVEFLLNLLRDEKALAEFKEDPEGYLTSCGISGLDPEDVRDAITVVEDDQDADHDTEAGGKPSDHTPPPVPPKHDGESDHEAAVKYLNTYITNNYVDDRDTNVDNSINQQVDTGGGDFDQEIDVDSTVVSGDGAVGAGGDITDSEVVTGNDNVVGEDNQVVNGNDNTTSFGEGDATSVGDVAVGDGSGFNTGEGAVGIDNSDNSLNDVDNDYSDNSENGSNNDNSDNSVDNVGNDNSDNSVEDSENDNSDNSNNSDNSDDSDNSDNSDNSVNGSNNEDISVA